MLSKEFEYHKNKIIKCIKYKDYETATYISMYLSQFNSEFKMLSAVLLFENKEYSRSLQFLEGYSDITIVYYKALNNKARKEYDLAISQLNLISEG
jgi:anaphase-promoting complex subunit 3